MVSQKITIKNPSGLHARPASILAQAAGKCSSNVIIVYGEKRIQVKSIRILWQQLSNVERKWSFNVPGRQKKKI